MHATLLSGAQLQERSEEEQGLFEVVWTAQVADAIGVANKTASYVTAHHTPEETSHYVSRVVIFILIPTNVAHPQR